jgi:hypothetical protein
MNRRLIRVVVEGVWMLEMMTNLPYTNDQSHPIPRFFCMGQTVWPTNGGVKNCSYGPDRLAHRNFPERST